MAVGPQVLMSVFKAGRILYSKHEGRAARITSVPSSGKQKLSQKPADFHLCLLAKTASYGHIQL